MNRNELVKYRKLVNEEIDKRKRINELLETDLLKEYLKIKGINEADMDIRNIREVIKGVLKEFKVKDTNGIYVCTSACYIDCHISYQDTEYYTVDVDIDSKYAERKVYYDIETGELKRASIEDKYYPLIKDFEKNNVVLNPYNSCKNMNGYEEVKLDYFESVLTNNQDKAKKMILSKYPRL